MIWVLVITMMMVGPDGKAARSVGTVIPYTSERSCAVAEAAFIKESTENPKPGTLVSIGCSAVKLPGVV